MRELDPTILDVLSAPEIAVRFHALAGSSPSSLHAATDEIAVEVAGRFLSGRISFEDADRLANSWYAALCTRPHSTEYLVRPLSISVAVRGGPS